MKTLGRSLLPLEIQQGSDASKVTVLLEAKKFEHLAIVDKLLGLIDYYEIIFNAEDLFKREYEFSNNKLNLILDLINIVEIPEDMMTDLRSAIIAAWRLRVPGSTREKRSREISMVLQSIERLRTAIKWAKEHPDPDIDWQLGVAILHSISLRRFDLIPQDIHKVQDLLDQAVEYLETMMGDRSIVGPEQDIYFSGKDC